MTRSLAVPDWQPTTALLAHQRQAVEKLERLRVFALFMEMGTGKSRTAIELVWRKRDRVSRVIWFCPVGLKETIHYEIKKHTDLSPDRIVVADENTREETIPNDADWYILGIESMSSSARIIHVVAALIDERTFVIVDESSMIKGFFSQRTSRITVLSQKARYRGILTGTPISQGLVDLYAQMAFLSPTILGYRSFYSFADEHIIYCPRNPERIIGYRDRARITDTIAPYSYQVRKHECLTLPNKYFRTAYFDLNPRQLKEYAAAKSDFEEDILRRQDYDRGSGIAIFRLFSRLQMICCGFSSVLDPVVLSRKREQLLSEVLMRFHDTHSVVFCRYSRNADSIVAQLLRAGHASVIYDGRVDERQRTRSLALWREQGGVLVATLGVASMGLDLTAADTAIFFSNSFKYAERIQAEDRLHRLGQENPVTYVTLVADCGIERRITAALDAKEDALNQMRRELADLQRTGQDRSKAKDVLKDWLSTL